MTPIRVSSDIRLPLGFSDYEIDATRDIEITFTAEQDCNVFVRISRADKVRIRTFAKPGVHATYLFWNEWDGNCVFDETHEVLRDADVHVAYCEANASETKRSCWVALREEGACGKVSTASLVRTKKEFDIDVVNFAPHTYGKMDNYSVVLAGGKYLVNATGKIVKGARASENHQSTRSLSFDKGQTSEIIPELLIDENDVQASHAMSVGRVDDDIVYYMMTRGLSQQQCMSLISTGYLMPIADTISDENLQEQLRKELEEKINSLC